MTPQRLALNPTFPQKLTVVLREGNENISFVLNSMRRATNTRHTLCIYYQSLTFGKGFWCLNLMSLKQGTILLPKIKSHGLITSGKLDIPKLTHCTSSIGKSSLPSQFWSMRVYLILQKTCKTEMSEGPKICHFFTYYNIVAEKTLPSQGLHFLVYPTPTSGIECGHSSWNVNCSYVGHFLAM